MVNHLQQSSQRRPWRLLQITDTHIQANEDECFDGMDTFASLLRVLKHACDGQWSADFILLSGDLVHQEAPRAYQRLRGLLSDLPLPVYCLPGNHDNLKMMREHLLMGNIHATASFSPAGWQILFLNSQLQGSPGGHLAPAELRRLHDQLQAYPDRHALVIVHHHPVPIGSPWMDQMGLDNADELFAELDGWPQVRALVCGHIHQEFHARRGDLEIYGTPSTCVQFRPESTSYSRDPLEPGYRRLELYPDGRLETVVVRLAPAEP